MDVSGVFNKIKSTFTYTVSEISAALPGNPLLREYDVGDQVGSAGPGLLWKIYSGVKKSTKADVALWVFEKKSLEHINKSEREGVVDVFRRGCIQLTKLRHPRVLTVEHSMEESRESLCFSTEPVFASLANVLGQKHNIANPSKELQSYELHEVEIKYGLMQISEALSFLHVSAKLIHGNLCPEAVIISRSGAWKIAGFDFCIANSGSSTEVRYQSKDWDPSLPSVSLPNPNYVAPEYILKKSCDTASDLYSLGVLLYSVYNNGKTIFRCSSQEIYRYISKNAEKLEHMSNDMLPNISNEVIEHEKMLLNPDPNVRPDAEQMTKLPFFNHVGVMTLQYLDSLLHRDNLQKSQFFKGLPKVLAQLPKRVLLHRVLPCLTSEFTNPDMIPFVLPSIMQIAEDCDKETFVKFIFPPLIPVFKLQKPVQILLILLQKMDLILSKTPSPMIQGHILPMLSSSLSSPSMQIQELCMSIIPSFADKLDNQAMKTSVMPKIRQIAIEGTTIAIRIHALVCVGKLVAYFDKWYVQDEILPFLQKIPSREPGILMGILGVYKTVLSSDNLGISKQVMATRCLPFLIPLSIENTLNLAQYSAYLNIIKEMMQKVETEHRSKLEQLSKLQMEQDTSLDFQKDINVSNSTSVTKDTPVKVDDIFNQAPRAAEPVAKQHLSLEEKQRLAKMKEQEYRMKKEGDIKPVSVAKPTVQKTPSTSKPKDLTSTLMQNNLNAMSISNAPIRNQQQSGGFVPMTTAVGLGMSSPPNAYGAPQQTAQWGNMANPFLATSSSFQASNVGQLQVASGFGAPAHAFSSTNGFGSRLQLNQLGSSSMMNRSSSANAFDGLLSMPSQQKKTPMNMMNTARPTRPVMPQGTTMMGQFPPMSSTGNTLTPTPANSSGNKQLSKDELLDFLG